ncbi:exocyst complex component EXO70B1-like [Panicum miliaceum]|uniref:Exocyst complex component EXO70B1-like n=1 Tax=Panicum miliaceum TaxID=4540 RepID=A0A3L6RUM0_PANMI|nr:exocyst complex component EXO70B1-like [Panicum miliaceum]
MLFDGAGDRAEADRFLRAVDDLRCLAPPSPAAVGSPRRLLSSGSSTGSGSSAVQVAMARLRLRRILLLHRPPPQPLPPSEENGREER